METGRVPPDGYGLSGWMDVHCECGQIVHVAHLRRHRRGRAHHDEMVRRVERRLKGVPKPHNYFPF